MKTLGMTLSAQLETLLLHPAYYTSFSELHAGNKVKGLAKATILRKVRQRIGRKPGSGATLMSIKDHDQGQNGFRLQRVASDARRERGANFMWQGH